MLGPSEYQPHRAKLVPLWKKGAFTNSGTFTKGGDLCSYCFSLVVVPFNQHSINEEEAFKSVKLNATICGPVTTRALSNQASTTEEV